MNQILVQGERGLHSEGVMQIFRDAFLVMTDLPREAFDERTNPGVALGLLFCAWRITQTLFAKPFLLNNEKKPITSEDKTHMEPTRFQCGTTSVPSRQAKSSFRQLQQTHLSPPKPPKPFIFYKARLKIVLMCFVSLFGRASGFEFLEFNITGNRESGPLVLTMLLL